MKYRYIDGNLDPVLMRFHTVSSISESATHKSTKELANPSDCSICFGVTNSGNQNHYHDFVPTSECRIVILVVSTA